MGNGGVNKDAICAACAARTCCYHYRVSLTGHDLWRIAHTLDLPPARFAAYVEAEAGSEDGFVLDPSGTRYELALAKSTETHRHGGCVFLVRTNDGAHRCGLGELRPDQCRLYPAYFHEGLARVINDPKGCWRPWSVGELDIEQERQRSADYERRRAEYQELLAVWNLRVWNSGGREFGFHEFCDYVENWYAGSRPAD